MSDVYFLASGALANPPAVVVTMVTCLILLVVRAWAGTVGVTLTRRVSLYVDGAIGIFVVLFVVFVFIRFKTLA
jgi:hypothetical protein